MFSLVTRQYIVEGSLLLCCRSTLVSRSELFTEKGLTAALQGAMNQNKKCCSTYLVPPSENTRWVWMSWKQSSRKRRRSGRRGRSRRWCWERVELCAGTSHYRPNKSLEGWMWNVELGRWKVESGRFGRSSASCQKGRMGRLILLCRLMGFIIN